jgi:hypothetical protein
MTTVEFFTRVVIVVLVALVPVLIWFLFDVILIAIGAILVAVLLRLSPSHSRVGPDFQKRLLLSVRGF